MRIATPARIVSATSIVIVLFLVSIDLKDPSPGELSRTHQQVSTLADSAGCTVCHGALNQDLASACLACHEPIAQSIASARGLHGTLDTSPMLCGECHSEHNGADFRITNADSFRRAGIEHVSRYDHARLAFELGGRHAQLTCQACHPNAELELLVPGQSRFLGLQKSCESCHENPHTRAMQRSCEECHGQEHAFSALTAFEHTPEFPLTAGHAVPSCNACHEPDGERSVEALAASDSRAALRGCDACHASPHSGAFDQLAANYVPAMKSGSACASCHDAKDQAFRAPGVQLPAALHAAIGFSLGSPHAETACSSCHRGERYAERFPGRAGQDCAACHADPHAGQFREGPRGATGCLACHLPHSFLPSLVTVDDHATESFPLTGSHAAVACSTCHEDSGPNGARMFAGVADACADCHVTAHRDDLIASDGVEAQDCGACHATTVFDEVASGVFAHDRHTRFALAGAHRTARCQACHWPAPERDNTGRRFGRISDLLGAAQPACAKCHGDVHDGAFDAPVAPGARPRQRSCAECHDETSFANARDVFEHGLWTGFSLSGAHRVAACESCHAPIETTHYAERSIGRAAGQRCGDCHTDVHAGQFAQNGSTSCERCHTSDSFSALNFDHDRDTRFMTTEHHSAVACAKCHVAWPLADGTQATRYKPLGTTCTDCHVLSSDGSVR